MTYREPTDRELHALLSTARTIAVVGASSKPDRPSNEIMRVLIGAGFRVVPVTPMEPVVLGRRAYATLADVPFPIDIVDVFRRAEHAPGIAREAADVGAHALWLQLGIVSIEAVEIAEAAGMMVVMDRCIGETVTRLGIDRVLDPVDEASRESFPASDPPAWTPPGGLLRRDRG